MEILNINGHSVPMAEARRLKELGIDLQEKFQPIGKGKVNNKVKKKILHVSADGLVIYEGDTPEETIDSIDAQKERLANESKAIVEARTNVKANTVDTIKEEVAKAEKKAKAKSGFAKAKKSK